MLEARVLKELLKPGHLIPEVMKYKKKILHYIIILNNNGGRQRKCVC